MHGPSLYLIVVKITTLFFKFNTDAGFMRAGFENACHCIVFGFSYPEIIFVLDGDLTCNILAAKSFIRW